MKNSQVARPIHALFSLPMSLRVAPTPESSAGRRCSFELPRILHPIHAAFGESLGCPCSSLLLQRFSMSLRVAPHPHPPAVPMVIPRVAPVPRSLGGSVWRIYGFPRIPHPPAPRRHKPRVAPALASSSVPQSEPSGCPEASVSGPRQRWIFGLPRISHPGLPSMRLRVAPAPASTAGS